MALRIIKAVIDIGNGTDFATGLAYEQFGQAILFGTEDHKEGVEAFLEKRPARFLGK